VARFHTGQARRFAADALAKDKITARAVSMPSWELFEAQDDEYRRSVLPPSVRARVAVAKASTCGWDRYTGTDGQVIGMATFGASAPLGELQKKFGFTIDNVVAAARATIERARKK